jgi:hypothetical protein
MTKMVRVENADSGTEHKLVVEIWEKGRVLPDGNTEPDTKVDERQLDYPADLSEVAVWGGRYLVVKEK